MQVVATLLFLLLNLTLPLSSAHSEETIPRYLPPVRDDFSAKELGINFGLVYGAQWLTYLATQRSTIEDHGSLKNWYQNPFKPHFDHDGFDYNIFQHSLSGSLYYLAYRGRGYTEEKAFFWSFLSSLAFEFTIETVTERPSFQDIYQTPVYGALLGMGVEKVSRLLHETDTFWGHGLGYLINPFTLLPRQKKASELSLAPLYDGHSYGLVLSGRFE